MKVENLAIQALKLFWETEEPDAPSRPLAKTKECPSYGQFEAHVKGKKFLNSTQLEHVNQCPDYCQKTQSLFRKHCGVSFRAVWEETMARIRRWLRDGSLPPLALDLTEGLEDLTEGEETPRIYQAVVEDQDGQVVSDEGRVTITTGPFLEDGYLVMGIDVIEPQFLTERCPIQLLLVSLADGQNIYTFELPDLEDQLLKTKLPKHLRTQKRQIEETDNLPFGFVLRASGKDLLLAAKFLEDVNEFPRTERIVYGVSRVGKTETTETCWRQIKRGFAFPVCKRLGRMAFATREGRGCAGIIRES